MSADLQWMVVRNNNAFLKRQRYAGSVRDFASEPGNVLNKNSFKFSGLVNRKTVDVSVATVKGKNNTDKQVVQISLRNKSQTKVKKGKSTSRLSQHMAGGKCKGAATVTKLTAGSAYRPDLTKYAVQRYYNLRSSIGRDGSSDSSKRQRTRKA